MDDEIGTPIHGLQQVRRSQGVVDDQGDMRLIGDGGDGLEIENETAGIGQDLDEDGLGLGRQGLAKVLRVRRVDELTVPAQALEADTELSDRAAVEVARRDEFVAGLQQREKGQELGRVAGCGADAGPAVLQVGEPFLEDGDGRVGETRIDESEGLEVEQISGVIDVVKDVRRGLVDRRVARPGDRIRLTAGVDGPGLGTVLPGTVG